MLIASALFVISSVGSALAFNAVDLTAWRLVGGLAIGAASVIAPAYIAEIAPANLRGLLGSLQQMAIVLGIFAALVVDYVIAQVSDGGASGEFPGAGPRGAGCSPAPSCPRSVRGDRPDDPRVAPLPGQKRRTADARRVLQRVMGHGDVDAKIRDIVRSIAEDRPVRLRDLRGNRSACCRSSGSASCCRSSSSSSAST